MIIVVFQFQGSTSYILILIKWDPEYCGIYNGTLNPKHTGGRGGGVIVVFDLALSFFKLSLSSFGF